MPYDNPYETSESNGPSPRKFSWLWSAIRACLAIVGLNALLGSDESQILNSAHRQGQVIGRAIGAAFLLLAVFPFGRPRVSETEEEEL